MAGPWLYPISGSANRSFALEDTGESIPVTVDSFRELVQVGRIGQESHWYISQLWKDIAIGDELFIYTGDADLGIIGYATVIAVEEHNGRWCIRPAFDLDRCRTLLERPVPAAVVREWVFPRRSVTSLASVEEKLRTALPW